MSDRRFGAFFFLLRQEPMPSLDDLATKAGVTALSLGPWPEKEQEDVRYGSWGGVLSVALRVRHFDLHDCVAFDFLQTEFLDLRGSHEGNEALPLEEDGALPVAIAFRDACERLRPEAAVMATHPYLLDDQAWLNECYSAVLGMDPNSLDSMGAGLTYVFPDMVDEWNPEIHGPPERDSLPVKEGKLLFRRTGWDRWF